MLSDGIPRSLEDILNKHATRLDRLERKPRGATGEEINTVTTYAQDDEPTVGLHVGDLWIDTDNENQMYRWNGTTWILYRDAGISRIETDNTVTLLVSKMDFEAASDNLVTTYWQSAAPGSPSGVGDLWVDRDDKKLYRWSGSAWLDQADTSVGNALLVSGLTTALGDGRIRTYFSFGEPIPEGIGDLWADTDASNKLYRWSGTSWVPVLADTRAQSAATAAILLNNYSTNPIFDNWTTGSPAPVGYSVLGATPVKENTRTRTAPYAVRWAVDNALTAAIVTVTGAASAWAAVPNMEYLTVTIDFQLVSGDLEGAGLVVDWTGYSPAQTVIISLGDEFPTGVDVNKWYRIKKVIKRSATPVGSFTEMTATLTANLVSVGTLTTKDIVFDQLSVRQPTIEEIAAYGLPTGTQTDQLPDVGANKISTFYTINSDPPDATAVGDLWVVVDRGNLLRRWDGSLWVPLQVGGDAIGDGAVDGPQLSGEIILASRFTTGVEGEQRVQFDDDGIKLINADETLRINVPTLLGSPVSLQAEVIADSLTVKGGATFESVSEISRDSSFTLASGTTSPITPPTLSVVYESIKPVTTQSVTGSLGAFTLNPNEVTSVNWRGTQFAIHQKRSNGTRVWLVAPDGTINSTTDYDGWEAFSETVFGGKVYFLIRLVSNNTYYLARSDAGGWFFSSYARINTSFTPAIGNNGASIVVIESNASTAQITVRAMSMSATSFGAAINTSTAVGDNAFDALGSWDSVHFGTFDYGSNRYVVSMHGVPYDIWHMTTGGVILSNDHFPSPTTNKRGMTWDGTNFWVYGSDGVLYKMSTYKWTTESSTWWVGSTWVDSNAGGTGLHETDLGSVRSITMRKRAGLKVGLPAIPPGGGVDDPDSWNVYLGRGSTTPANSAMHLQTTGNTASTTLTSPSFVSAAPPTVNNFPGANPGSIESGATSTVDSLPAFWVDGSGDGRWEGEDWHTVGDVGEPAFVNSHTAAAGYPVQFRKDPVGNVHLRGVVDLSGPSDSNLFTLPAGYRPIGITSLSYPVDANPTNNMPRIVIFANGVVQWAQKIRIGTADTTAVHVDHVFSVRG